MKKQPKHYTPEEKVAILEERTVSGTVFLPHRSHAQCGRFAAALPSASRGYSNGETGSPCFQGSLAITCPTGNPQGS